MKAVRVLLFVVGALAALLLLVVAVALNSSFQTWAARRALAARPELRGSLGAMSAGLNHVEIRDLKIETRGAVLTLPALVADLPLVSAGLGHKVFVKRLVAKGWTLDLTNAKKLAAGSGPAIPPQPRDFSFLASAYGADTPAAEVAPVFRGILTRLQLPVDLALDGVELEGEAILPPLAGHESSRIKVTLRGGGLAAGREGTFVLDLAGAKSDGGAFTLHSTVVSAMDSPRTLARLGVKADAMVSGTQFPEGVKLSIDAAVSRTSTGESYALTLVSVGKQLAALQAELVAATSKISGQWKLDLQNADVEAFALGRPLPVFVANGEGRFETGGSFEEIHTSGRLKVSAEHLEALRPQLAVIGLIALSADFDVLHHGNALRVERLDVTISGAAPIARVRALQDFEFNLATAELRVADPAQDLVAVTLDDVPLAWAQPFLGELTLTGGDGRGEFVFGARDGGLALRAKTPFTLAGVTLARAGQPLLRDIDLTLTASADYTPLGWQAQVTDFVVRHGNDALLSLNAKAGQLAGKDQSIKFTGRWTANLPAWLAQPAASGRLQLASGDAQGDLTGSLDRTKAFEGKVALSNLVALTKEKLPALTLEARVDVAPNGAVAFQTPVTIVQADRKSDLLFAGTLTPGAPAPKIDVKLTSDRLVVEDVRLLALLLPGEAVAASPAESPQSGRDAAPFWSAVNGQLTLALKKVVYSASLEMTNVGGTVRLDPATLAFDGVRGAFGADSDFKLAGQMKFDAKAKQPYALAADVVLNNFDTAPAFRALDPAKPPTVESRVTLNGHITGGGGTVGEVGDSARGEVRVTGKSGLFRALSTDLTDKVQRTQSTVAAIGGILGAVTGKKEYADYANKTQILTDIAKYLSEIPFDQLSVTATRDDALNVVLKDFTLISPEVRLTGGGNIKYVEGTPLLAQPLDLELKLGARGKLADLLKRARLLEETRDNLGYAAFSTPIKIGGSLAKTNTNELRNALLSSALEKSGILDRVLGK